MSAQNRTKKFNSDEIAMFCDQIAMLLNSGIAVYDGTFMLYSEMEDGRTRAVLEQIDTAVRQNIPLYKALEETDAFPKYMVHMVSVGEKTGRLEEVLRALASFYERDSRVKAGIRSAVAYPVILFAVMTAIMVILAWKILPMFERMFEELSSDVAESTGNVLRLGLTSGRIIAIIVCALLLLVILILIWNLTPAGNRILRNFISSFGPTKKLSQLMATGKFISALSLMVSSGMDIRDGLEQEENNCDNRAVRERIGRCIELYDKDTPLDEALRNSALVTGMDARIITVAAKTGESDVVFNKLSDKYNEKVSASLSRLTTIIETTLVIVLSVMVGAVLLSVMLPLVSMISSIG